MSGTVSDAELYKRLDALSPVERTQLLTGANGAALHSATAVGLRALVLSDGPAGVRGTGVGLSSASFPNASAAAATWDLPLARRVGTLLAAEAHRHGVDVVLAPTANLHRTPYEGRHFEYLSEDPVLTAAVVAELVRGLQTHGIAACVKHFVANETETERTSYVARLDERTLAEVYLPPFEAAVSAGVWVVMATYNGIDDGVEQGPACEHHRLVRGWLKRRWGFEGVVLSDWMAAQDTIRTADAGLDLVMPGPGGPWSDGQLLAAMRSGAVAPDVVDDKVIRLLRLAGRVGALEGTPRTPPPHVDLRSELRRFAARAMVVLRRGERALDAFPVSGADLRRVALIGPNAFDPFVQGSGSVRTYPDHVVTPVEGLRARLPRSVEVLLEAGCDARTAAPLAADELLIGARFELLDGTGAVLEEFPVRWASQSVRRPGPAAPRVRYHGELRLTGDGTHLVEVGVFGAHTTWLDGDEIHRETRPADAGDILASVHHNPRGGRTEVEVTGSRTVRLQVEVDFPDLDVFDSFTVVAVRHQPPRPPLHERIAAAVAAARAADVAVVVVGNTGEIEYEGVDRTTLALPGAQDELVRAVAGTGTPTVVVVNAGAPVILPWLDEVDVVIWAWLPGQEFGHALADVLLGVTEPAGRLPWTLPAREDDVPPRSVQPVDGVLAYTEGRLVGHRGWDALGRVPARPFGYGLGWTRWSYDMLRCPSALAAGDDVDLIVRVTNTGPRRGTCLAQVYLEPPADPAAERPMRQLAAFGSVELDAGVSSDISLTVPARAFAIWDVETADWRTPTGAYALVVGSHSRDAALRATVEVK